MDKWEKKVIKIVCGGIAVFLFGVFAGYNLENNAIDSIQGFLFNAAGFATDANATDANATDANATDANATDANATDANATDANATDANATDANATDANLHLTDDIIYLQDFFVETKTVKSGDKINVVLNTVGAPISGATIVFKNNLLGVSFTTKVQSLYNNPYIIIPASLIDADYIAEELLIIGRNSDGSTFSKKYGVNDETNHLSNQYKLIVKNESVVKQNLELSNLVLKSTTVNKGEKVYLEFTSTMNLESLRLRLESENDFIALTVKDLNKNPYIEIPTTAKEGIYNLKTVFISSQGKSKMYSTSKEENTEELKFNVSLEVLKSANEKQIYENDKITSEMTTELYQGLSDSEIVADNNPLIKKDIFDAFKGKNKNLIINIGDNQIIFNGRNIQDSKDIDVSIKLESVSENEKMKSLLTEGVVVSLADNGNLPGPALYRIKANDNTNSLADTIYVYAFNDSYNKFVLEASKVVKTTQGYYEFTLSHNSDYVLVNKELDSSLTMKAEEQTVDFQKSNKTNLLLIISGIALVIISTVVVIVVRRIKKGKNSQNSLNN